MAILTSSQQTFVDITDQRKLSAYITSNLPKTQAEDPNTLPHTYAPSWKTTNLQLTPVVFLDQTSVPLGSTGLTICWRRKDGVATETNLITGESASGGILTVSKDVLADSDSGMITYICYISYYDAETKNKEKRKGKKGNGCQNRSIREDILLQEITGQLGWNSFDGKRFDEAVEYVVVGKKNIRIMLKNE